MNLRPTKAFSTTWITNMPSGIYNKATHAYEFGTGA